KNRVHGIGWAVSGEPDTQGGQARLDEQDQNERARHRLPRDAARRRHEHSRRQREKKRVRQHQRHPPELAQRDAPQQQRNRQHGEDRQQTVKAIDRCGRQLTQHDVVTFQVGQEQKSERAFALFLAQAVGGVTNARYQAAEQKQSCQRVKDVFAQFFRRLVRLKKKRPAENE